MIVGKNIAVIADDKSRTETALLEFALRDVAEKPVKKIISEWSAKRGAAKRRGKAFGCFCRADVYYCGFDAFS